MNWNYNQSGTSQIHSIPRTKLKVWIKVGFFTILNFRIGFITLYFNRLSETLGAIGELQASSLELTVTPSSDDAKFIVGEWAEVKVTSIEDDFYSKFR